MYYHLLSIVCLVVSNCRALSLFCLSFFLGKLLVHCLDGVRRSPTLVLAYLMIHHDMTVEDAIDHVIKVRRIRPNMGFLKLLIILNSELLSQRNYSLIADRQIKTTGKSIT